MREMDAIGREESLPFVGFEARVEKLEGENRQHVGEADGTDLFDHRACVDAMKQPADQRGADAEPSEEPHGLPSHAAATARPPLKKRRCQRARLTSAQSRWLWLCRRVRCSRQTCSIAAGSKISRT